MPQPRTASFSSDLSSFNPPTGRPSVWDFIQASDPGVTTGRTAWPSLFSTVACVPTAASFARVDSPGHTIRQAGGATFQSAAILHDVGENALRIPHPRCGYNAPYLPRNVVPRPDVYRIPLMVSGNAGSNQVGLTLGGAPISSGSWGGDILADQSHSAYENIVVPSTTILQHQYTDSYWWIIPQTVYTGGYRLQTPVAPACLNILVGDILHLGRLGQLRGTAENHNPAFPDPEGQRKNKKFTVRFAFEGFPNPTWRPRQINEYHKPEGSAARVPLSRIDFAVAVVDQLCDFLRDQPLRLRGHSVDMMHLVIAEIVRPSKGSVQPVLKIHPDFWWLYG